jgi:hypothetical protein
MSTTSTNKLKSKLNKMATTGVKRKRKVTKAVAVRRRASPTKRRKKRTLSAGAPRGRMNFMQAGKETLGGAVGGAIFTAPAFFIGLPLWGKLAWGLGASVVANLAKYDHVGAGISGAMVNDIARSNFGAMLNDGELEDAEYVDPSTLSDTGFMDEGNNSIVKDTDGTIFALNDDGSYQAIGTTRDLPSQGISDSGTNMTGVSMLPLMDAYSLSSSSPFSLNAGY